MVRLKKPSLGNKILYEIAIGIVAVILLVGVLNTVTHTEKVPIITSDIHNYTIGFIWGVYNATDGSYKMDKTVIANLSDVSTFYNGYLYIVPIEPDYDSATEVIRLARVYINCNMTWDDLIDAGINGYDVEIQVLNNTDLSLNRFDIAFSPECYWDKKLIVIEDSWEDYLKLSNSSTELAIYNGSIDVGSLLLQAMSADAINKKVYFYIFTEPYILNTDIDGFKLKFALYATSEEPIFKMFTEPAYGIIAGLWSTLVAVYHRIRQYALSFFGGFSISALFTGLIGDPTTALIITAAVVAVFFFALARPAPRRRHD